MNVPASSLFTFGFQQQSGLPKVVPKITRADMGLILPRLDDSISDTNGDPDINKKRGRDALIEKYRAIYVLGGRIVGTKLTEGKKKDEPGVRFIGQFKAIVNPQIANLNVGVYFVSSRMHVPKFFEEVLYAEVLQAKQGDPNAMVEILIGVGMKAPNPTKPSITGYEWTVEPLVDMSAANDPVDALFNRGKDRLTLAGPAGSKVDSGSVAAQNGAEAEIPQHVPSKEPESAARETHRRGR